MSGKHGLVPLQDAFTELQRIGLKIDADGYQRMRKAGLVCGTQRIPGTKTFGIDEAELPRLRYVLQVKAKLRGRPTIGKIALELAMQGDESIPPTLIRKELARRIQQFRGMIHRALQRYAGFPARLDRVSAQQLSAAAKRLAHRFARNKKNPISRARVAQNYEIICTLFLKLLLDAGQPLQHVRQVREMLAQYVQMSDRDRLQLATQLVFIFEPLRDILTLQDRNNHLLRALATASDEAVREALLLTRVARSTFSSGLSNIFRSLPMISPVGSPEFENLSVAYFAAFVIGQKPLDDPSVIDDLKKGETSRITMLTNSLANGFNMFATIERRRDEQIG